MSIYLVGRLLGWTIVIGYTLTMLNFVLKRVNRLWIMKLPKDSPLRTRFQPLLRTIVTGHRWFALTTAAALLTHFTIQVRTWGFFPSGIVAGSLLITQVSLGAYGTYIRSRKAGPWLIAHRTVSVLLLMAIIIHVLIVRG